MARAEPVSVSLYAEDWAIVDEADTANAGRSATLRRIIREWKDQREGIDRLAARVTQLLVEQAKEGE